VFELVVDTDMAAFVLAYTEFTVVGVSNVSIITSTAAIIEGSIAVAASTVASRWSIAGCTVTMTFIVGTW